MCPDMCFMRRLPQQASRRRGAGLFANEPRLVCQRQMRWPGVAVRSPVIVRLRTDWRMPLHVWVAGGVAGPRAAVSRWSCWHTKPMWCLRSRVR